MAVEDTNLHGYKDGSHVGVDVCRESGRGSCYDQDVGDAQQWNQHEQRLGGLPVLLSLQGVGRTEFRDQHLRQQ